MEPKRKTGRPPGKDYPVSRTMLLTKEDLVALQGLASAWGCSATEAVRRLIRREAKRLRIVPKVEQSEAPSE